MRMLRGLVFDMDGVIIDSHPAHRRAWQEFLGSLGRHIPEEKLDYILEGRKRKDILRYFLGELTEPELLNYGKQKDEFFQRMSDEVPPVAGVMEFLDELGRRGIPTALATSASKRRTCFTLERLKLQGYFQAVITGDDVDEGKPNPAIYRTATEALGLPVQDLVAVEDAARGVEAARAAGMRCIGIADPSKAGVLRNAGAGHVISNFVGFSVARLQALFFRKNSGMAHVAS